MSNIYEFTTIALHMMAELFEEAASDSVKDLENREDDSEKLYRWYHTTMNYAMELRRTAELITLDSNIEVSNGINGELLIIIDNKPYIITSPSIKDSDHDILESRIVEFLCQINHCPVAIHESLSDDNKRKITINADWSLEEGKQPAFVTRSGLHFEFEDLKNRGRKQTLCLEMITDISLILETLREIHQKGIIIDWDELKLEPVVSQSKFKLVINRFGDAILFKLSRLTTLDIFPVKIKEWFSYRAENRKYHLFLNADELFDSYIE